MHQLKRSEVTVSMTDMRPPVATSRSKFNSSPLRVPAPDSQTVGSSTANGSP